MVADHYLQISCIDATLLRERVCKRLVDADFCDRGYAAQSGIVQWKRRQWKIRSFLWLLWKGGFQPQSEDRRRQRWATELEAPSKASRQYAAGSHLLPARRVSLIPWLGSQRVAR